MSSEIPPEMYTVTPALFAQYCSRFKWFAYEYLLVLSDALIKVATGETKHLMIFMPPRHGKSELASKYFPAWFLGHNPDKRVMLTSYEADFAASWGYKARNILDENGHLFGLKVSGASAARNRWDIEGHNGGMVTAGVGGPITGKGAHCLPAETLVYTNFGLQRLDDVVRRNKYDKWYNYWLRVLAYDHIEQKQVWKRVTATRTIQNRRLLEITTACGDKIRATDEHRFFVCEQGYTEAHGLRKGDKLLTIQQPVKQDMRILQGGEERQGCTLQAMLSETQDSSCSSEMFSLWGNIRNPAVRLSESTGKGAEGLLLFNRMFTETPCCEECKDMCLLWKANARKTEEQILLSGMQTSRENDEKIKDLSMVQCLLHPEDYESGVLFEDLCQQRPFEEHDRYGEFELQGRDKLCKAIQGNEKACSDKGYENMRSMWEDEALTCSSCRREPTEQPTREPDNTLQDMSFCSPQIGTDTISTIERVSGDSHTVYDIQVEDCNNFFAGNILVHNCLIIDDPVKNSEDANSKTMRDKAAEWYKSTAYTRLEPGGAVIIIQTRWHEDDLSGRLLEEEPDKWTVINLPAIAEEEDPLGRMPGEALSPHRYTVEDLTEIKNTLGPHWFSALYQQHPQPLEGAIFKQPHFKYWKPISDGYDLGGKRVPASTCRVFQTCDPAASTKSTADYFVLGTWAQTKDNDLILLDLLRNRLEGPDQVNLFKSQYQKYSPAFQAVESNGAGKVLYQMLVREGLPVRELKADKDKVTRALPAAARMEGGTVYFPVNAQWLGDFESELLSFPTGAHDDQVDVLSYAVQMVIQKRDTKVPKFTAGFGLSGGMRI